MWAYLRNWVGRKLFLPGIAFSCAMLTACAPLVASHDTEVQRRAVRTSHGLIHVAVEQHGQGRPILLIHGLGTSGYTWREIAPGLAKHHRVISIDLRGFGASDKPVDEHYTIADQADLVEEFVKQEGLKDLTIVGHSYGGGVALFLALKLNAERRSPIRNMVLIDTIAYRQPMPIFFRLLKVPGLAEVSMTLVPPEVQATQALRLAYYDKDKIPAKAIAEYAGPLYSSAAKHALAETVDRIVPDNIDEISAGYKTLKIPTQIIWGDTDKVVPLVLGKRLQEDLPMAELTILSQCGHLPHEEKPRETLAIIESFLAHHGG